VGLKFPEIRKVETLESKYIGKISKSAMSFLKACLRMDQFERITAA
jgi:cyclin-dependent kinase-like